MAFRPILLAIGVVALGTAAYILSASGSGAAAPVQPAAPPARIALAKSPEGAPARVRTMLYIAKPMRYGEFVWDEEDVPPGKVWVRVDLAGQTISVFKGGHEVGTAVILYGADAKPTPPGLYPVIEKREQHRSNLYDAEMPYMIRLTNDGIAIHASDVRAGAATNGCIGVPMEFAKRLFAAIHPGNPVLVVA